MVGNIMVAVNDIMPSAPQRIPDSSEASAASQAIFDPSGSSALGITARGVPAGAEGNGSPTANFSGLLQTIISGLEKGTGNPQNGTSVSTDGKTVSLIAVMQQLFINSGAGSDNKTITDKKTDPGNTMSDLLQQMIAQLQASVAQPGIFTVPGQSANTASPDGSTAAAGMDGNGTSNNMAALIAALEQSLQAGKAQAAQQTLTGRADNATPGAGNEITEGFDGTMLSTIAQQSLTDSAGKQTSFAANGTSNDAASSGIGQQILTDNAGNQPSGTLNAATLSVNPTTNATNSTAFIVAGNSGNPAGNVANATVLNTAGNAVNPAINATNSATFIVSGNSGNPAANALDAAGKAVDPAANAMNAATPGANGAEGTVPGVITPKNSNNNTDSAALNADHSTLCAAVSVQQTPYANDAKPVQETLPASRLNELSEPILKTLGSGDSNLVIKLSPPDMGTIQIRLKMENGVLTADFKVDSTAVKDMFTTVMPQIKQSIESSGIKTGSFFTDLKEDSFTDGRRQQDDTNRQQQKQNKEQESNFFDYFA